jgi:hypothetical protein
MDQVVFIVLFFSFLWLSVISAALFVTIARIRRIQQMGYIYLWEKQEPKSTIPEALSTRESAVIKAAQMPPLHYRHNSPSEHVAIAIQPDEGPTRIEVHVQRIIKHLQADKKRTAG